MSTPISPPGGPWTSPHGDPGIAAIPRTRLVLLVVLVAVVWFGSLDLRHLLSSDEGRYAQIAKEMWLSGDWVTPRYNDVKYFEKPPLHMWVTALAYTVFGVGEWQARLCVALFGVLGIAMTTLAARRWFGDRTALAAGLVLLASPNWNIGAHFNALDMSVSGALAAVLAATLIAQHPQTGAAARRRWMWAAWAAMGVAVLTKGLIGLALPGLVLVVYTAWSRDFAVWRRLHIVSGTLVLLATTVPWFWLVAQRNPEFLHFFFIHEHFQRYTSTVHHRSGPIWYFVPQLLAGFLPWIALWPGMVAAAWRHRADRGFQPVKLLAAWALSIFVFFSLSGSKLPGYILPVMPALAILAALALERLSDRGWRVQLIVAAAFGTAMIGAAVVVGMRAPASLPRPEWREYAPWVAAAGATMIVGAAWAWAIQRRGARSASLLVHALAMFVATVIVTVGHETFGRPASGADLAPRIRARLEPGMPLYGVRRLDHTLPFYLGRTLVLVDAPDELEFGLRQEPQRWIPSLELFEQRWADGPRALAVMSPATHALLRQRGLTMHPVAADARRVVVANFPSRTP
jgi:4-amino-4-deoxy-L-arabinose transferase-like glycosyltransferase